MSEMHSDPKHARSHGKNPVETGDMRLEKAHKDWYKRGAMGKQLGKPKYAPPTERKVAKSWKRK